ncbi:MAG: TonB-dependent receptor, partial [Azoarcus sp.]
TADLLGSSHEVFIQKSQLGGGSPIIRGFSANSVLIVVDGVRMNNAIYRSGNLQNVISIDPNTIEEAEVVFGPGSIRQAHTKDEWLPLDELEQAAEVLYRFASAGLG